MGDPVTIGLAVGGTLLSAYGQYQQGQAADAMGKAQQQAADYQAAQMQTQAGQERAASQRKMIEERRRGTLAQSKAQALAAASGGSSLDPSIVDIMGDLEAETQYNVDVAQYEGEDRARDLEMGGSLKQYEGRMARQAGKMEKRSATIAAAGSLLKGGSTLMEKYG